LKHLILLYEYNSASPPLLPYSVVTACHFYAEMSYSDRMKAVFAGGGGGGRGRVAAVHCTAGMFNGFHGCDGCK